jgi:hypothetical protein
VTQEFQDQKTGSQEKLDFVDLVFLRIIERKLKFIPGNIVLLIWLLPFSR